jgi:hypothetical protein
VPSSHFFGITSENCAYSCVVGSKFNVTMSGWFAAEAMAVSAPQPPVTLGRMAAAGT